MAKKSYLLIALLAVSPFSFGASFDCAKAGTAVEKLICKDETLSKLDEQLANSYKQALADASDKDVFKHQQIDWLKSRSVCTDTTCLIESYRKRISAFGQGEKLAASSESKKELTFTLVKGEENEVCHSYIKMLKDTHYEAVKDIACERKILPVFPRFERIDWLEIQDGEKIKNIMKDNIKSELSYSNREVDFDHNWFLFEKAMSEDKIRLFFSGDFKSADNKHHLFKMVELNSSSERFLKCGSHNLFYFNGSNGSLNENNKYAHLNVDGSNDLFKIDGELSLSSWSGSIISDGSNLDVYGAGNKKLCGILVK